MENADVLIAAEARYNKLKAEAAKAYIECTNPACRAEAVCRPFSAENASFLEGCDLVIDALDNMESRLLLEEYAERFSIPLIHGAVCGWSGTARDSAAAGLSTPSICSSRRAGRARAAKPTATKR